jgi:hypothetical protein
MAFAGTFFLPATPISRHSDTFLVAALILKRPRCGPRFGWVGRRGRLHRPLKEFPEVISEGEDCEQAVANLMDALGTYLAWKSTRHL